MHLTEAAIAHGVRLNGVLMDKTLKGKIFKARRGRLNETEIRSDGAVVKKAVGQEYHKRLRLRREKWALEIAKVCGVNVPKVIDYYLEGEVEMLITTAVDGVELTFLSNKEKAIAMQNVGQQMLKLFSVSRGFGWPHPEKLEGEFGSWDSFLLHFVNLYGGNISRRGIVLESNMDKVAKLIRIMNLQLKTPHLIHRDIKPSNILQSYGCNWIIDWENALLGDYLFDVASYGANYGHDSLWQGLAKGMGADVETAKYKLYEVIILIGVIDFLSKQGLKYTERCKELDKLIQLL